MSAWFRTYEEVHHNRKLQHAAVAARRPLMEVLGTWTTILALASASSERGTLLLAPGVPLSVADLVEETRLEEETLGCLLEQFRRLGMLAVSDGVISVCNWDRRQFTSDDSTERVRRYREAKSAGWGRTPAPAPGPSEGQAGQREQPVADEPVTLQKRLNSAPDPETDPDPEAQTKKATQASTPSSPTSTAPEGGQAGDSGGGDLIAARCSKPTVTAAPSRSAGQARRGTSPPKKPGGPRRPAAAATAGTEDADFQAAHRLLLELGCNEPQASEEAHHPLEQVRGWIEEAHRRNVDSPPGFVLSKLFKNAPPPEPSYRDGATEDRERASRRRFIEGPYAGYIEH